LLASLQEGDAIALVMAGKPVRVRLAPTASLADANVALEGLQESDRATDLEGALRVSEGLLAKLPQVDKRIVLLSDLADGASALAALKSEYPLWSALKTESAADCAVVEATRAAGRVNVQVACSALAALQGRSIEVRAGEKILGTSLGQTPKPVKDSVVLAFDDTIALPEGAPEMLTVRLTGTDAIASDDVAPVLAGQTPTSVMLVTQAKDDGIATGGGPLVKRGLRALRANASLVLVPAVPDTVEELKGHVAAIVDDPAGLTPEQRRALAQFVERGGMLLLALGPNAARPPLGSSFDPFLNKVPQWATSQLAPGISLESASLLGESAASASAIEPKGRSLFTTEGSTSDLRWSDSTPLLSRKPMGRGEHWTFGLPFTAAASDFPLRPAFLALLNEFTREAISRTSIARASLGESWVLHGNQVSVTDPLGETVRLVGPNARFAPSVLGIYKVSVAPSTAQEIKIAKPAVLELDFRPHALVESEAQSSGQGKGAPLVDLSRVLAVALLLVFVVELVSRVFFEKRAQATRERSVA
jgi:hypothetical protein